MLASRFSRHHHVVRSDVPLTDDQIRRAAPSIFAEEKHTSRSDRYTYIPTSEILTKLRQEGFEPFMAAQTRVRDAGKHEHAKHLLRLRHVSQQAKATAPRSSCSTATMAPAAIRCSAGTSASSAPTV